MKKQLITVFFIALVLMGCQGRSAGRGHAPGTDSLVTHARLLHMERGQGFTRVTVDDPWNPGAVLATYVLVPRGQELPAELPQGTLVRTPLEHALVYSSVHTGVMKELGAFAAVRGVVDAQYFNDSTVARGIAAGVITDCGSSMQPTIEKVINMKPDAILLSPYQDAAYGQITKLGTPIIECADYMESTPLGRAEWIKFYGELTGQRHRADSIFNAVEQRYNDLKRQVAAHKGKRPVVLTENVISGVWNVPGGHSYMARLIIDAGGVYPWADDTSTGSLSLDFNQVLAVAQKADVWLIKSFNIRSLEQLRGSYALNDRFEAFKQGRVYGCDTNATHFFERFPFHPDVLLTEYYNIFYVPAERRQLQFFDQLK